MNRSHVIRLNPTKEQEVYFRKACGVTRHAYNWALARWKETDLSLSDRVFNCEVCGLSLDRDLNAARNIQAEALRLVTDVPVVASSERNFACGAGSSGSLCGESETFCNEAGTKVL